MTDFRPTAYLRDGVLHVAITDAEITRTVELRCVLDQTDFGDVVGVEVLDFARQLEGGAIDPPRGRGEIRWSYDDEIDALYVHVGEGRGQIQQTATLKAHIDQTGKVVGLTVPSPWAS